jgi:hypothetical protein
MLALPIRLLTELFRFLRHVVQFPSSLNGIMGSNKKLHPAIRAATHTMRPAIAPNMVTRKINAY